MNPIEEYFSTRKTQLWVFKHGIKVIGAAVVSLALVYLTSHPSDWPYMTIVIFALNEAKSWLDKFNPDAYLPGVGAGKSAPRKK